MKFCELETMDYTYHFMAVSLSYDGPLSSLDYQTGDKFVVKVRLASIKGVRMIFEHIIEKLPNREVCRTHSYIFRTEELGTLCISSTTAKMLLCSRNLGGNVGLCHQLPHAILHKPFYTEKDAFIKISTSFFSLQQILEAKATAVCLNKDYRPSRIPPELLSKLQLYSSKDSEGSSDDADNRKNSCS